MKVISIDGVVGVGKSLFAERLISILEDRGYLVVFVPENVKEWTENGTLELLYQNKLSPAYFQTIVFADKQRMIQDGIKRLNQMKSDSKNTDGPVKSVAGSILIVERMHTDTIFMKTNHVMGNVTDLEMAHYEQWSNMWNSILHVRPANLIVYINAPIDVCMARIKSRARQGEQLMSVNFQNSLHSLHEKYFETNMFQLQESNLSCGIPIIRINSLCNYKDDMHVAQTVAEPILEFIKDLYNNE